MPVGSVYFLGKMSGLVAQFSAADEKGQLDRVRQRQPMNYADNPYKISL